MKRKWKSIVWIYQMVKLYILKIEANSLSKQHLLKSLGEYFSDTDIDIGSSKQICIRYS